MYDMKSMWLSRPARKPAEKALFRRDFRENAMFKVAGSCRISRGRAIRWLNPSSNKSPNCVRAPEQVFAARSGTHRVQSRTNRVGLLEFNASATTLSHGFGIDCENAFAAAVARAKSYPWRRSARGAARRTLPRCRRSLSFIWESGLRFSR
jgi:hypothetical protein